MVTYSKMKNSIFILFSFLIFLFFLKYNEIPKKTFSLLTENYNKRMIKIYGFCEKDGYGFLKELKDKYKFEKNIKIINFKPRPPSDWIINKVNSIYDDQYIFLINYVKDIDLTFVKKNNFFYNTNDYEFSNGISKIKFNVEEKKISGPIKIIIKDNKDKKIYEKQLHKIEDDVWVNISFRTKELNSRWDKFQIQIQGLEKSDLDKILDIKVRLISSFNIDNYQIIENSNNCYLLKK